MRRGWTTVVGSTVVAVLVAVLAAGCGTLRPAGSPGLGAPLGAPAAPVSTPAPTAPVTTPSVPSPAVRLTAAEAETAARAEAERLLTTVVWPHGSGRVDDPGRPELSGPGMGVPYTSSLIDITQYWTVPLSLDDTMTWFADNPPTGLTWSGATTGGTDWDTQRDVSWAAPGSPSWTWAGVGVRALATGTATTVIRVDGVATWLNPVPRVDDAAGPRLHVTVASGCPASDKDIVGVTNPGPPLTDALLPPGTPVGGLRCAYEGVNGHPYQLKTTTVLSAVDAAAIATAAAQLPLSHVDGGIYNCPMIDGSAAVIVLVYPDGRNVNLWLNQPCSAAVANGYITVDGTV